MNGHPIRVVAARTGLSPHLIRIWERRYRSVEPERTGTNRRLYSDADIRRLQLLKQAVDAGESIGQVSSLDDEQLEALVGESFMAAGNRALTSGKASGDQPPEKFLQRALEATGKMDQPDLERIIMEASVSLSQPVFLRRLVEPLMDEVGSRWHSGEFRVAHEHMASATVRTVLGHLIGGYAPVPDRPKIVCTTPSGQLHEIGALISAISAASMGWNVTYLGPSIPAEDIAGAVRIKKAAAVALSLTYPENDPRIAAELDRLRRLLPADLPILVGGRAVATYRSALKNTSVVICEDLVDFMHELSALEHPASN